MTKVNKGTIIKALQTVAQLDTNEAKQRAGRSDQMAYRDERREFADDTKILEDAAQSLRAFVEGDGSPVDANQQADQLEDLLTRVGHEFNAAERDSIQGAIERLNACEDGEINSQACEFCANALQSIIEGHGAPKSDHERGATIETPAARNVCEKCGGTEFGVVYTEKAVARVNADGDTIEDGYNVQSVENDFSTARCWECDAPHAWKEA